MKTIGDAQCLLPAAEQSFYDDHSYENLRRVLLAFRRRKRPRIPVAQQKSTVTP